MDRGHDTGYMMYLFCGGIVVTAVLQGGFYPGTFLVAAIFFAVVSSIGRRIPLRKTEKALWILAGWYLLAAMANGWDLSAVSQACLPGSVAVALCCAGQLTKNQRQEALRVLTTISAVLAGIGILAFGNVFSIVSATTARRLQFPFQYANAAGSWFAAMSLLAQWDREETERSWPLILLQTALFLTRSVGACGLYVLAEFANIFHRRKEPECWQTILITNGVSACFAAGFYLFQKPWATVALCVLLASMAYFLPRLLRLGRQLQMHWVTLIGIFAVATLMGGGRLFRSLATFAERLYQIKDGLRIATAYPVFGVGAGNWAYVYPVFQSAEYSSTVVHSGPIQVAVDAGFPALLLLAVFFTLAWRAGKRPFPIAVTALLLSVHSLFDFGLQFFPVAVLTGFLLLFGVDEEISSTSKRRVVTQKIVLSLFAILCIVLLIGIWQSKQMTAASQRKEWSNALEQYDASKGWFGESQSVKVAATNAAAQLGKWDRVLTLTESNREKAVRNILLRATALRMTHGEKAGCQYLLDELERRPYQTDFYEATARLLIQWHAGTKIRERYNALAEQFNRSENILTRLQGSARVYIYTI